MNTIKCQASIELIEKKSRFIGNIKPIANLGEAKDFINEMKAKYIDARHNCTLYRFYKDKEFLKYDDDKEPKSTAGKPMAEVARLMDVCNFVLVVSRYFGGIKLGASGLIRTYAKTAKLSILEAKLISFVKMSEIEFEFSYENTKILEQVLVKVEAQILSKNFEKNIKYKIKIPSAKLEILQGLDFLEKIKYFS